MTMRRNVLNMTMRTNHSESSSGIHGLLDIREAAGLLDISQGTLRNWLDEGYLPFIQFPSGVRRIRRVDVDAILTPVISVGGQVVAYDASGVA